MLVSAIILAGLTLQVRAGPIVAGDEPGVEEASAKDIETKEVAVVEVENDQEEEAGEGRFLASFFFPLFPQYWPIDVGDNLNNLKSPKTVARFVYRDLTSVRCRLGMLIAWL